MLPIKILKIVKISPVINAPSRMVFQFERSLSVLYPIKAKTPNSRAVPTKA